MSSHQTPYLLPHLIEHAAQADPNHIAMVCRDRRLSYGELFTRSVGLARWLVDAGVRKGDRVGIFMNKAVDVAVAMYGIMRAGAAYVPLDPTAPEARTRFVIEDCAISYLVSEDKKLNRLQGLERSGLDLLTIIGVESGAMSLPTVPWDEIGSEEGPPVVPGLMEQDLAYVLYTSGSTGVPKGIMHSHRSALSWANTTVASYEIGNDDVISNYAPIHFDLSTLDFFGGARAGATTVMIPEEHMKLPASLAALLDSERLTLFYTVPMALVQLATTGALDGRNLDALRRILFGGEPMPMKHLRHLMDRLPHTRFFNVYGPTEVNGCTHHEVTPRDLERDALPIGTPYPNVEGLIVGENDSPLPAGESGELLIRAPTMMRGYWARPDLNDRAFYHRETFAGLPETFHRTGDLVHADESGLIHFHGRKDRQIKSRGYRVELDEVEAVLLRHPEVEEGAVFAVIGASDETEIRASAILRRDSRVDETDLLSFMGEALPLYAMPSIIEVTETFPRTSTGKIDRRQLAAQAHR